MLLKKIGSEGVSLPLATLAFLYVMLARKDFSREIRYGVVIIIAGLIIYFARARHRREWPFAAVAVGGQLGD